MFIDIIKEKHAVGKRRRDEEAARAAGALFDKRWGDAFEFARGVAVGVRIVLRVDLVEAMASLAAASTASRRRGIASTASIATPWSHASLVRIIVGRRRDAVVATTRESRSFRDEASATQAGELNMLNKGAGDFPDQIYDFHQNYGTASQSPEIRGARSGSVWSAREGAHTINTTHAGVESTDGNYPTAICDLAKLSALNLLRNQLTELPDRLGDLSHLRHLDIATNRLQTLPLTFGNLTRLERVVADCNDLRRIPENAVVG